MLYAIHHIVTNIQYTYSYT